MCADDCNSKRKEIRAGPHPQREPEAGQGPPLADKHREDCHPCWRQALKVGEIPTGSQEGGTAAGGAAWAEAGSRWDGERPSLAFFYVGPPELPQPTACMGAWRAGAGC